MMGWPGWNVARPESSTGSGANPSEPCPLCDGLGGWDRSGRPVPCDETLTEGERTKCQGCDGSGDLAGWLREAWA